MSPSCYKIVSYKEGCRSSILVFYYIQCWQNYTWPLEIENTSKIQSNTPEKRLLDSTSLLLDHCIWNSIYSKHVYIHDVFRCIFIASSILWSFSIHLITSVTEEYLKKILDKWHVWFSSTPFHKSLSNTPVYQTS